MIDASKVEMSSPPTYWHCEPEWSWHARPLPDYLLWYVLEGRGVVTIGHETVDLLPGTCVVFKPGDEPVADQDRRRRLRIFGLHFEVAGDGDRPPDVVPRVPWCRLRDRELAAALARRCDTSYRPVG
jgi:AraC family transcriptional regulator of arabinose operon